MVRMLQGKGDANPNRQDVRGQTPISCALENGHDDVDKFFSPRKDSTPTLFEAREVFSSPSAFSKTTEMLHLRTPPFRLAQRSVYQPSGAHGFTSRCFTIIILL